MRVWGAYFGGVGLLILSTSAPLARAGIIFSEDFSNGWPPSGWVIQNNSNPVGTKTWGLGGQDTTMTSPTGD